MAIPKNQIRSRNTIEQHEHCDDANARRSKLVDENGDPINEDNPLPTTAEFTGDVTLDPKPDEVEVFNIFVSQANVEQELILPAKTEIIMVRLRGCESTLKLSWVDGGTTTAFITVKRGAVYTREADMDGRILYFSTSKPSQTLEVEAWHK